jgi:hypothetical protein
MRTQVCRLLKKGGACFFFCKEQQIRKKKENGGMDFFLLLALVPQLAPEGVFMVTAEVSDDLLTIDRQVHRLLVDGEMLVPRHAFLPKIREQGVAPPRNHQITQITQSLNPINPLSTADTPRFQASR